MGREKESAGAERWTLGLVWGENIDFFGWFRCFERGNAFNSTVNISFKLDFQCEYRFFGAVLRKEMHLILP